MVLQASCEPRPGAVQGSGMEVGWISHVRSCMQHSGRPPREPHCMAAWCRRNDKARTFLTAFRHSQMYEVFVQVSMVPGLSDGGFGACGITPPWCDIEILAM